MIRKAKKDDMQAVLDLVKELASFEKEPESVTTTLHDYVQAFEADRIRVLLAEEDGRIVGTAVYYWAFSTWRGPMMYLEDFVVRAECRGKGIGQRLFDAFIEDSRRSGAVMVKWEVLDWNEGAIRFYQRNGATIEKQWWDGKIIF